MELILVIMDGFSRFDKLHLLKSKSSSSVNKHIEEYAGLNKNNAEIVTYIMPKTMMYHVGFRISLWSEALQNDVYIKNRIYNKGI
ncbi:Copiatype Polyprotein [Phytophthora palmivora]|uniref:Copiatype Polyprotein n=1 Tax=Phytophthora palmivora TaxID=4796 RepID=A0A2P4YVB3_9STRA|nr:Copiatype Polyprotein [Phytophthora palmivora]